VEYVSCCQGKVECVSWLSRKGGACQLLSRKGGVCQLLPKKVGVYQLLEEETVEVFSLWYGNEARLVQATGEGRQKQRVNGLLAAHMVSTYWNTLKETIFPD
jgi:hypothetical protein